MTNPPWRAEDISVEWLNMVLEEHANFKGTEISSFDIDLIAEEFGFIREVWRLKLNYVHRTSSAPESIAAKFASRDPHLRSLFVEFTDREVNVYRRLGSDSEFIMPRCYFSTSDPETGDCAILMEDLSKGRLGDNFDGISERDAEAVVKAIAVFHAKWWENPDLKQPDWQPTYFDRAATQRQRFVPNAQKFLDKYSKQVDDEFKEVISLYSEKLIPIFDAASSPPLTLIHGDLHAANIFFDTEFRGCSVTAIDWQSTARGKGVSDISYLAMLGLTVDLRRAVEDKLVRLYHDTLVAEGVTGYSIAQCLADYRSRFLYPFVSRVGTLANLDLTDEQEQNIATTYLDRTSAALHDHDLVGLLRAM